MAYLNWALQMFGPWAFMENNPLRMLDSHVEGNSSIKELDLLFVNM